MRSQVWDNREQFVCLFDDEWSQHFEITRTVQRLRESSWKLLRYVSVVQLNVRKFNLDRRHKTLNRNPITEWHIRPTCLRSHYYVNGLNIRCGNLHLWSIEFHFSETFLRKLILSFVSVGMIKEFQFVKEALRFVIYSNLNSRESKTNGFKVAILSRLLHTSDWSFLHKLIESIERSMKS